MREITFRPALKRTLEDEAFGREFALQLTPFYEAAIASGQTEKQFAVRLGVDRGGLQRYLKKHATPSVRTIVCAYREFGIAIPYAGLPTTPFLRKSKRSKRLEAANLQMRLPLTIEAPEGEIDVRISKKSNQRYRLQLSVKKFA